MNANEARKLALENKAKIEDSKKSRETTAVEADTKLLLEMFKAKIDEAVKTGNLSTHKIEFPDSRFAVDVVRNVSEALRGEGYILELEKNNAYQKVNFIVKWA